MHIHTQAYLIDYEACARSAQAQCIIIFQKAAILNDLPIIWSLSQSHNWFYSSRTPDISQAGPLVKQIFVPWFSDHTHTTYLYGALVDDMQHHGCQVNDILFHYYRHSVCTKDDPQRRYDGGRLKGLEHKMISVLLFTIWKLYVQKWCFTTPQKLAYKK